MSKKYDKILVIGDAHIPFANMDLLREIKNYAKVVKPDLIIQIGDLCDMAAWSRYPKDPDMPNPTVEFEAMVDDMNLIHEMFPKMTILLGNHDRRVIARAMEVGVPKQLVKQLHELFPFDGWVWHTNGKPLIINDIAFMHGDEPGKPLERAKMLGMPTCSGHTHQAAIEYATTLGKEVWAMQCGAVIDIDSMAFRYSQASLRKATIGFGVIDKGVPIFIPASKL